MKNIIFLISIVFGQFVYSQSSEIVLSELDGVRLSYTLTKIKESKKKIKYNLTIITKNTHNSEVYFAIPTRVSADGKYQISGALEDSRIAHISIDNSTNILSNSFYIRAKRSGYVTTDNRILMSLAANEVVKNSYNFSLKKELLPQISGKVLSKVHPLSDYSLKVTPKLIEGIYVSNCDYRDTMDLRAQYSLKAGDYLQEFKRNRGYNVWTQFGENEFHYKDMPSTLFVYDKKLKQLVLYTENSNCIWRKVK